MNIISRFTEWCRKWYYWYHGYVPSHWECMTGKTVYMPKSKLDKELRELDY